MDAYEGNFAHFWSSGEYNSGYAYGVYLGYDINKAGSRMVTKDYVYSVRCVQDSTSEEKSSSSNRSSSSNARLSSGEIAESSSSTNAGFVGGTLVDSRDGQTYKTVVIGSQTWMAENLNFKTDSSFCYNNSAGYCEKYGRLYIWESAKSACPRGWHLPTHTEWNTLIKAVGGSSIAGTKLKSTSGWNNNGNGTDTFGFSALPAGYRINNGDYGYEGNNAYFWSSTKDSNYVEFAYHIYLRYNGDLAYLTIDNKDKMFSVRCLKD